MRIAMLVPRFPAVSETFFVRQAIGLPAVVYTHRLDADSLVPDHVQVWELRSPKHHPPVLIRAVRQAERLILHHNGYGLSKTTRNSLQDRLTQDRPDVLLAQYGPTGLEALQVCRQTGTPLVVHFHGHDLSSRYRERMYRYSLQGLVRYAAGFVVVNETQRARLSALGCPAEKIDLIPYGVPVDEFVPSQVSQQPACRFLAVGRLVAKKSPEHLLRAFAACLRSCPDVVLNVVGGGPLEQDAHRLAQELGLGQAVQFLGWRTNAQVRELMQQASVFVQHSVTAPDGDEEGWPVAVAEACASGLPVVSTRHAGIPEQVLHGKTGYLVEEGDWESMGRYMRHLAQDPDLRLGMGLESRKHIQARGNLTTQIGHLRIALERAANSA